MFNVCPQEMAAHSSQLQPAQLVSQGGERCAPHWVSGSVVKPCIIHQKWF